MVSPTGSVDRRHFLRILGGGALLAACSKDVDGPVAIEPRLAARPTGTTLALPTGRTRVTRGAEILAYLPAAAAAKPRVPLLVYLHGADRAVETFVNSFQTWADESGVMILAPYAAFGTWDAIHEVFGPDVHGIDEALTWAFGVVPVDPSRLVLAGFSDGASYALSIGPANGDVFPRVVAFSPGSFLNVAQVGRPSIVVSHGTQDPVLPFATTRDALVPALRQRGHEVEFVPFDGGHAILGSLLHREFQKAGG